MRALVGTDLALVLAGPVSTGAPGGRGNEEVRTW